MGELEQLIEQAILKHSKRTHFNQVVTGVVTEVGETTCTVERENAPTLYEVRLNAIDGNLDGYLTVYPAKNTTVAVGVLDGVKEETVLLRCGTIEKLKVKIGDMTLLFNSDGHIINDGNNGGLTNIEKLISWMQNVYSDLQTLKTLLSTSPVAGNGAALAIVFSPSTSAPNRSDLEDTKVKH